VVNDSKLKKDNKITSTGLIFLKESLKKNQYIKEINFNCKFNKKN
jgi:hypothetical protein